MIVAAAVFVCGQLGIPTSNHASDRTAIRALRELVVSHLKTPKKAEIERSAAELHRPGVLER